MASDEAHPAHYDGLPMYWLILIGVVAGCIVVIFFEWLAGGLTKKKRVAKYSSLMNEDEETIDSKIREKLELNVDGPTTVFNFWLGAGQGTNVSRDQLTKGYECLALISALMFSVCITFYVEIDYGDHLFGIVSCIANCALCMATLSSTFFVVAINSLTHDNDHPTGNEEKVQVLIHIYGENLMRVPAALFVWGTVLLFLQFTLFFKLRVDPGFPCSVCLAACFIVAPLFFHGLHKMSWAINVTNEAAERMSPIISVCDIEDALEHYCKSKGGYCLSLDKSEFMKKLPGALKKIKLTSMEIELASQLFDEHSLRELEKLRNQPKTISACFDCESKNGGVSLCRGILVESGSKTEQ